MMEVSVRRIATRAALAVAALAVAHGATAAPISFASTAGVNWTTDNAAVCAMAGGCSGSTVAITPHAAWQGNDPDGSGAEWISFANTGITGNLAPINQANNGRLMSIEYAFQAELGSLVNLKVWADDTAGIWFNGVLAKSPNLTQGTCAVGKIGCEPNEGEDFSWAVTGVNNSLRIDVYQVGTTTSAASNPFGVLYYGSYETPSAGDVSVPEPATLALVGLGLLGAGVARRRLRR